MPILYTMPGTCAMSPAILANWCAAPIEIKAMKYGEHKNEDYLSINPKGYVPALKLDDGTVVTEALAILHFISMSYGSVDLRDDILKQSQILESLSYLTSEVHADYAHHFAIGKYAETETAQNEIKEKIYAKLKHHYQCLNEQLHQNGGEWLLGFQSAADTYLYTVLSWTAKTPLKLMNFDALNQFYKRMDHDSGVIKAKQDMNPEN